MLAPVEMSAGTCSEDATCVQRCLRDSAPITCGTSVEALPGQGSVTCLLAPRTTALGRPAARDGRADCCFGLYQCLRI